LAGEIEEEPGTKNQEPTATANGHALICTANDQILAASVEMTVSTAWRLGNLVLSGAHSLSFGFGRGFAEVCHQRLIAYRARRSLGTPATYAASRWSTSTRAPGMGKVYCVRVIGPRTVIPVSPVYSKLTVLS